MLPGQILTPADKFIKLVNAFPQINDIGPFKSAFEAIPKQARTPELYFKYAQCHSGYAYTLLKKQDFKKAAESFEQAYMILEIKCSILTNPVYHSQKLTIAHAMVNIKSRAQEEFTQWLQCAEDSFKAIGATDQHQNDIRMIEGLRAIKKAAAQAIEIVITAGETKGDTKTSQQFTTNRNVDSEEKDADCEEIIRKYRNPDLGFYNKNATEIFGRFKNNTQTIEHLKNLMCFYAAWQQRENPALDFSSDSMQKIVNFVFKLNIQFKKTSSVFSFDYNQSTVIINLETFKSFLREIALLASQTTASTLKNSIEKIIIEYSKTKAVKTLSETKSDASSEEKTQKELEDKNEIARQCALLRNKFAKPNFGLPDETTEQIKSVDLLCKNIHSVENNASKRQKVAANKARNSLDQAQNELTNTANKLSAELNTIQSAPNDEKTLELLKKFETDYELFIQSRSQFLEKLKKCFADLQQINQRVVDRKQELETAKSKTESVISTPAIFTEKEKTTDLEKVRVEEKIEAEAEAETNVGDQAFTTFFAKLPPGLVLHTSPATASSIFAQRIKDALTDHSFTL